MNVIEVRDLSKRYRIGLQEKRHETLAGQIGSILRAPIDNFRRLRDLSRFGAEDESVFWALKDINFDVQQGDVLGIIGHNGAGKSTLLKILSRITEPTSGEIRIKGRISALLEVGTGFHPELTGRENIYMNGTILGMTRKEIDRKLDEIVDFSGVEKYIDTPVKFYSSGMKVRLGFAVAAHLEPEILIIDEVLAVGDAEFQRKCLGKMESVANSGRTVLFVSHDLTAIENICKRVILLTRGQISFDGEVRNTIAKYYSTSYQNNIPLIERKERRGKGVVRFEKLIVENLSNPSLGSQVHSGDKIAIHCIFKRYSDELLNDSEIAISFTSAMSGIVCAVSNRYSGTILNINQSLKFTCIINELTILPGEYFLTLFCAANSERQDVVYQAAKIDILPKDVFNSGRLQESKRHGYFYMNQTWKVG